MDTRLNALQQWLSSLRAATAGAPELRPLTPDASFRRFFRVTNGWRPAVADALPLIAVDAPPASENNAQFAAIGAAWHQAGIRVPQIFAADVAAGFFVVEDLGDDLLFALVQHNDGIPVDQESGAYDALYESALDLTCFIQDLPGGPLYPPYEAKRFHDELGIFQEWVVDGLLADTQPPGDNPLHAASTSLVDHIAALPTTVVHRDWHSRNLLRCAPLQPNSGSGPNSTVDIGVVDFQDALWGPYIYDVVSLLRDCYIGWRPTDITRWLDYYAHQAKPALQAYFSQHPGALQADFDYTGIQRQLKALGIFARLFLRDGRPGYLSDMPRVLAAVITAAKDHAPLGELADWLATQIQPALTKKLTQRH